jgi:iron complex transport system permease protein
MKITLDLSKLVEEGKLTPAQADHLKALAKHDTGSLGINILIGFGVIAVAAGAVTLLLTIFEFKPLPVVIFGAAILALGIALTLTRNASTELIAQILTVIGALSFAGALMVYDNASLRSALAITLIFGISAVVARSSLLMGLAVLALGSCLGARTGYSHAMYSLAIQEPTLTIVVFSGLALAAYLVSQRLKADYERLAITAARVSVLLVNFGFWIGSLWGDRLVLGRMLFNPDSLPANSAIWRTAVAIPASVFTIGWALALLAVGIWGARENRRWVVNVAAVFGGIHFYTQWFSILGANALSVLGGGILILVTAMALYRYNKAAAAA